MFKGFAVLWRFQINWYWGEGGGATKSDTDMAQVPQLTNKLKKIIRSS